MDGKDFAALLAVRFQKIVPSGVKVEANDGHLILAMESPGGFFGGRVDCDIEQRFELGADSLSLEERALRVGIAALDDLQDFIDEETTEPWPANERFHQLVAKSQARISFSTSESMTLGFSSAIRSCSISLHAKVCGTRPIAFRPAPRGPERGVTQKRK